MVAQNIYKTIAWEAMRLFEKEELSFNFVPVLIYKTEEDRRKAFEGGHYYMTYFALEWLYQQLLKNQIIQDENLFDFAEHLQLFLPELINQRWEEIKWEGDFSMDKMKVFNYPVFPFKLDEFTLNLKALAKKAEAKRIRTWKASLPKFPTLKVKTGIMDENDKTNDYYIVHFDKEDNEPTGEN